MAKDKMKSVSQWMSTIKEMSEEDGIKVNNTESYKKLEVIELKSDVLVVVGIKRKSNAKMIGDLEVGDKIQLTIDASPVGRSKGTYASYIKITNLQNGKFTHKSFNCMDDLYNVVELAREEDL